MLDINSFKLGYDTPFLLDDFNKPLLLNETGVIKNVLLFILFSKPGQYPSLPNIGLDIESLLYSFYDEIDVDALRDKIIFQCNALETYFDDGIINIRKIKYKGKPSLMIHVGDTNNVYSAEETNIAKYQIGITFNDLDQMIYNISD